MEKPLRETFINRRSGRLRYKRRNLSFYILLLRLWKDCLEKRNVLSTVCEWLWFSPHRVQYVSYFFFFSKKKIAFGFKWKIILGKSKRDFPPKWKKRGETDNAMGFRRTGGPSSGMYSIEGCDADLPLKLSATPGPFHQCGKPRVK